MILTDKYLAWLMSFGGVGVLAELLVSILAVSPLGGYASVTTKLRQSLWSVNPGLRECSWVAFQLPSVTVPMRTHIHILSLVQTFTPFQGFVFSVYRDATGKA